MVAKNRPWVDAVFLTEQKFLLQFLTAINKVDIPTANPEKIKEELAQMDILVEDWGGKYQSQEISAKQGLNIESY